MCKFSFPIGSSPVPENSAKTATLSIFNLRFLILNHAKSNSARTQKGTTPDILDFADNADITSTWTNVSSCNLTAHEKLSVCYEDTMYSPLFLCSSNLLGFSECCSWRSLWREDFWSTDTAWNGCYSWEFSGYDWGLGAIIGWLEWMDLLMCTFPLEWKIKRIPALIYSIQLLFCNVILSFIPTLFYATLDDFHSIFRPSVWYLNCYYVNDNITVSSLRIINSHSSIFPAIHFMF